MSAMPVRNRIDAFFDAPMTMLRLYEGWNGGNGTAGERPSVAACRFKPMNVWCCIPAPDQTYRHLPFQCRRLPGRRHLLCRPMRLGESNEGLPLATLLSLWATGYYALALTRDIGDTSGAMHCAYAAKQVRLGDGALRGVGHHLLRNAASIASQRASRARMAGRSS